MRFNVHCIRTVFIFTAIMLFASMFNVAATSAQTIGYYNLNSPTSTAAATSITTAGHTPLLLSGLATSDLAGVDVVWILNPDNNGYATEFSDNLAAVSDYVQGGGVLMFHDRRVTEAATVIPGAGAVTFVRDPNASIELGPGATGTLLSGPGGIVDADSLDGLGSSTHGYAVASTLPAGSTIVLTRTDSNEVVDFYYSLGGGNVYYSTIPLDAFLGVPNVQAYAANLAAFIFELVGANAAPLQFQHIAMADTLRSDIDLAYRTLRAGAAGMFVNLDSTGAERGRSAKARSFRSWDTALTMGYSHEVSADIMAGAAFSYHQAGNRSKHDSSLKGEYESYGITAFGRFALPAVAGQQWWLDLVGNYSLLEDVELERGVISGETDGCQYGIDARIGTVWALGAVSLYPQIGVEHIQTRVGSYKEKGVGALKYGVLETDATYGLLSLEARTSLLKQELVDIDTSLLVEYRKRLGQSTGRVKTTLADTPSSSVPMELYDYDSDLAKAELKLAVQYRTVTMEMRGGYAFGNSDLEGLGGSLSLHVPL